MGPPHFVITKGQEGSLWGLSVFSVPPCALPLLIPPPQEAWGSLLLLSRECVSNTGRTMAGLLSPILGGALILECAPRSMTLLSGCVRRKEKLPKAPPKEECGQVGQSSLLAS